MSSSSPVTPFNFEAKSQEPHTLWEGVFTVLQIHPQTRVVVKYRYLYLYLYLSTILSVLDVLEYLIAENAKYLYLYLYLIQSTW